MNEEIDAAMTRVMRALEAFEESKTLENARECEWKLTIMKLLVGADNFDQLPAFSRALKEASAFVDKYNIHNTEDERMKS